MSGKYSLKDIVNKLGSDDVKQILKALEEHPSSAQQFFDAFHHHRQTMRSHLFHYIERLHADAIIYPTVSLLPPKIADIHGPEWTLTHNGQKVSQFMITAKNVDVASAANLPAISLPSVPNPSKDNLPIGVEIASLTGYDRKLISVARAIEKVVLGTHL